MTFNSLSSLGANIFFFVLPIGCSRAAVPISIAMDGYHVLLALAGHKLAPDIDRRHGFRRTCSGYRLIKLFSRSLESGRRDMNSHASRS